MKRHTPRVRFALVILYVALCACGSSGASLELALYTPSPSEQLPFDGVRLLRVQVNAPGQSLTPRLFDVSAGLGRIDGLPLARFVTVVIDGLGGADSAPLARGYSAPVDLLGGAAAQIPVFFAQIDRFAGNVLVSDRTRADLMSARVGHSATLLKDGRVLVVGGANLSALGSVVSTLSAAELFDPTTGRTTTVGSLGFARAFHTATLLKDGRVFVAGGMSPSVGTALATAEIFDPAAGTFRNAAALPESRGRASHTATLLPDGRVLLSGGWGHGDGDTRVVLDTAEVFDPATGRYAGDLRMRTARASHSATLLFDGRVLLVGGRASNGAVGATELFDASRSIFSDGPNLPGAARAGHAAVRLGSGRVMLVGGCSGPEPLNARASAVTGSGCHAFEGATSPASTVLSRVDVYEPSSGAPGEFKSSGLATLQVSRADAAAVALPGDSRVLVVGGTAGDGATTSVAEIIEEGASSFTRRRTAGSLREARALHSVTRLASGVVMVAGGSGRAAPSLTFSVLNAIELYVP